MDELKIYSIDYHNWQLYATFTGILGSICLSGLGNYLSVTGAGRMSLIHKIGTGMKNYCCCRSRRNPFGCSANAGSAGTHKSQLEMPQEVAEPIKQEIRRCIASKIDLLKSEYDFCTHERGFIPNDAGLQRCMKVTTEGFAGLEKN